MAKSNATKRVFGALLVKAYKSASLSELEQNTCISGSTISHMGELVIMLDTGAIHDLILNPLICIFLQLGNPVSGRAPDPPIMHRRCLALEFLGDALPL